MAAPTIPRFTVVVPTFNRGESLATTLETIRSQTITDFEVIVVDDGSDVEASPLVASLRDERFRCVRQENAGPSAARNRGAAHAAGRWLVFLDDDDRVEPRWLEVMGHELERGAAIVFCGLRYSDGGDPRPPDDLGAPFGGYHGSFIPGTFALERARFSELGGYEESLRFSENTELMLRVLNTCRERGLVVVALDEALVIYTRPPDRADRIDSANVLHACEYLFERHGTSLARDPQVLANYLGVAGLHAARLGRRRESVALFARSLRLDPHRRSRYGRLVVAALPPVSARVWGRAPSTRARPGATLRLPAAGPDAPVRAALLHAFDPSALLAFRADPASTPLPYRLERITDAGVEITLTDAMYRGGWRRGPVAYLVQRAERRTAPFLQTALMRREIARSPVTIAMFESQANSLALARAVGIRSLRRPRLVVIECWLARDAARFGPVRRRLYRFTYRWVDALLCFSTNQQPLLAEELRIPASRIHYVPFGVDTDYFTPDPVPVDGGYVLAVGRDAERDWKTFFAAVRDLDVDVKVACREQLLAGLDVPPNVEVLGVVSRAEYRELLAGAQVVVVATNPVAYPTGQSVLLEAMSMGRCCVVTESPALADYVSDDTALVVPAHDPAALRAAIARAVDDRSLRQVMGARARERVLEQFGASAMWRRIGDLVRSLAEDQSATARS